MTTKFFSEQMDAENDRQRSEHERAQKRAKLDAGVAKAVAKRHADQQAAAYQNTRGTAADPSRIGVDSILHAVDKGGSITLETLTELLELLRTKTDYHFHVEVAVLPSGSALLKTIDNERDAKETVRRLKTKP